MRRVYINNRNGATKVFNNVFVYVSALGASNAVKKRKKERERNTLEYRRDAWQTRYLSAKVML